MKRHHDRLEPTYINWMNHPLGIAATTIGRRERILESGRESGLRFVRAVPKI